MCTFHMQLLSYFGMFIIIWVDALILGFSLAFLNISEIYDELLILAKKFQVSSVIHD